MSSLPQMCRPMESHHGIDSKIALIYFLLVHQAVRQLKVEKKSLRVLFFFQKHPSPQKCISMNELIRRK